MYSMKSCSEASPPVCELIRIWTSPINLHQKACLTIKKIDVEVSRFFSYFFSLTPDSFWQQIDKKQEYYVTHESVTKLNKKKREEVRYCFITSAAFYLCKPASMGHTIRIYKKFAWIDLISFEINQSESFNIEFPGKQLELQCSGMTAISFLTSVLSYVRYFLPESHPAIINIPPELSLRKPRFKRNAFVDMFVSSCHSLMIPIEIDMLKDFEKNLKAKRPFFVSRKVFPDGIVRAICNALKYTTSVPYLDIGGKNFPDLYRTLRTIMHSNRTITKLHLVHYGKDKGFRNFTKSLTKLNLSELIFEKIEFDQKMMTDFVNMLPKYNLISLSFVNCNIKDLCPLLFNITDDERKDITSFNLCFDKTVLNTSMMQPLISFVVASKISELNISYTNTDINELFNRLSDINISLTKLDLSGNKCGPSYNGKTTLPVTLKYFILADVKWEGNSMVNFCTNQQFGAPLLELNLSGARLADDKAIINFHGSLPYQPPTNMVTKLVWNKNHLSKNFMRYVSNFKMLQDFEMNGCKFLKHDYNDGIPTITELLANSCFTRFSAQKSLKQFPNFLLSLQDAFANNQTILKLDIGRNHIKEEMLETIFEILYANDRIKYFNFDGTSVRNINVYIQFIKKLTSIPHLRKIAKPLRDFNRLRETSAGKYVQELKYSWSNLCDVSSANARKANEEDMTSNHYSFASDSQSMTDSTAVDQILDPTWELQLEPDPLDNKAREEWNHLKQQFSYVAIFAM